MADMFRLQLRKHFAHFKVGEQERRLSSRRTPVVQWGKERAGEWKNGRLESRPSDRISGRPSGHFCRRHQRTAFFIRRWYMG